MKVLVTYYSQTGNTEKLAHAVYAGVEDAAKDLHIGVDIAEKSIASLSETEGIDSYDLILCGFPVQSHSVPPAVIPFLKSLPEGKKVALFVTHGSRRGSRLAREAFDYAATLAAKATIIGTFGCRGKVKSEMIDELAKKPEHKAWAEEALGAIGHPNEADFEDAKEFAKNMIKKAQS